MFGRLLSSTRCNRAAIALHHTLPLGRAVTIPASPAPPCPVARLTLPGAPWSLLRLGCCWRGARAGAPAITTGPRLPAPLGASDRLALLPGSGKCCLMLVSVHGPLQGRHGLRRRAAGRLVAHPAPAGGALVSQPAGHQGSAKSLCCRLKAAFHGHWVRVR